jgi:hypothetical protein
MGSFPITHQAESSDDWTRTAVSWWPRAIGVVIERCIIHRWKLGFRQFSFHHIARVLQGYVLNAFGRTLLRRHASVPFGFRRQVSR